MKTRNLITAIALSALTLGVASCTTKQQAMSDLQQFTYELRDNGASYGISEWKDAGDRFVKIRKRISKFEDKYTADEKTRIGKMEGQCAGYVAKGLKEKVKAVGGELKGILQGITEGMYD